MLTRPARPPALLYAISRTDQRVNETESVVARKSGLDPLVAISLTGILLFFLLFGSVAYRNLESLRDNSERIFHSHKVIVALGQLLSRTQDAETGQRGFLLTNDERNLEPYDLAVRTLSQRLQEIVVLTSDNPSQQARIETLKLHVDAKLAELKETIELRRTRGLDAAPSIVNSDKGKREMDDIRAELASMGQVEADLR